MFFSRNSQIKWNIDSDGFLRCKTAVMKSGVMIYTPEELGYENIPKNLHAKNKIYLYVPADEVQDVESLKSLEGRPVSLSHEWKESGKVDRVGNVSGAVSYDDVTNRVMSDILIDDPIAIKKITEENIGKLEEQSAGYTNSIEWISGYTKNGEYYDGIQRSLRYNHIMLLPRGEGRAGEDIRIINKHAKRGSENMAEFTTVKIGNTRVRVINEDVDKLVEEVDKKEGDFKNRDKETDDSIAKLTSQIEAKNEEVKKVLEERDILSGKVSALQEQLDALNDPEARADAISEAVEEQQEAEEIINKCVDDEAKAKNEITNSRKLFGHKLRVHIVNAVRSNSKQDALTDYQLNSEPFVLGVFSVLKDTFTHETKKVAGASLVKTYNKNYNSEVSKNNSAYKFQTAESRKNILYGKKLGELKNG